MNFGISMSVCFAKAREFMKERDLSKAYLNLLNYFTDFASKNNFKIIEIASFPPFDADVLYKIKDEIKKSTAGFEVIYHLPSWEINIGALNSAVRKTAVGETKKLVDLAKELGIKKVSMHPGCYTAMPDVYALLGPQVRAAAQNSVLDIFSYCKNKNLELCIENLPFDEPFFRKPEEFEIFMEKGIGLLVDTAHATTSEVNPVDFVRRFTSKISEVHLVDGFKGKKDTHYALGTGEVNCAEFLDELARIKYKGPVIFELKSEKDLADSIAFLKKQGYF